MNVIALETDKSVVNIDDEEGEMEDLTVKDAYSALPESRLRILNQGEIKVKYQISSTTTPGGVTPQRQNESLMDNSQIENDQ